MQRRPNQDSLRSDQLEEGLLDSTAKQLRCFHRMPGSPRLKKWPAYCYKSKKNNVFPSWGWNELVICKATALSAGACSRCTGWTSSVDVS